MQIAIYELTYCHADVGTRNDHYFWLTGINQSINLTCERTCGENYTESWLLLLNTTDYGMQSIELTSEGKVSLFEQQHGELAVQMHRGSDIDCDCTSSADLVGFSLELVYVNSSIHTFQGDMIVSCSAAYRDNAKVYTPLSMVVYLPAEDTCSPTTTYLTCSTIGNWLNPVILAVVIIIGCWLQL